MENERIYKFVNKENQTEYQVTKEELQVLKYTYNKEKYMFGRQYSHNNTLPLSFYDTEYYMAEELLEDAHQPDPANHVLLQMLIKEMFSVLTPREQKLLIRTLIEGYNATELTHEFGENSRSILREKNAALGKVRSYLSKIGINSYVDVVENFLQ